MESPYSMATTPLAYTKQDWIMILMDEMLYKQVSEIMWSYFTNHSENWTEMFRKDCIGSAVGIFTLILRVASFGIHRGPQSSRHALNKDLGAVSIRKTVLPGMAIPMLKIRRPNGRLIFNMEITIRR